jgi:exodeoxyribonuclease VII small subunit
MDFEKSLAELEKIVQEMENSKTGLSRSIELYEKGIILYKKCKDFIKEAEKKITVLSSDLQEEEYK